mgnify:CR=1 FL=1
MLKGLGQPPEEDAPHLTSASRCLYKVGKPNPLWVRWTKLKGGVMILTLLYESQFVASVLMIIFILLAIVIQIKILRYLKDWNKQ